MSRDFILVFSGGMVALITTLIVLFVADYFYRRERERETQPARPKSPAPTTVLATAPVAITSTAPLPAAATPAKAASATDGSVALEASPPKPVSAETPSEKLTTPTTESAPVAEKASEPSPSIFPPPPETIAKRDA